MKEFIDKIEGVEEGTDINRANLMAMQGFIDNNITITENNSVTTIVELNGDSEENTTTITENVDGTTTIVEVFVGEKTITKTTTISASGTVIAEVIS